MPAKKRRKASEWWLICTSGGYPIRAFRGSAVARAMRDHDYPLTGHVVRVREVHEEFAAIAALRGGKE